MPTIGKPKPRFLKVVAKPTNVGNVELSKAEPVYIDGLPTGGGLQDFITDVINTLSDLMDRVTALEGTP